jgi:SnoaL-like domain
VRRIIDSLNAGRIEEALRVVADDFEIDWSNSSDRLSGVYRGRQGATEFWTSLLNAWTTVHLDPVEAIDADDSTLIVEIRVQMRRPGAYDDDIYAHLWTIGGGKAERVKLYQSKSEALEAAGLRE